MDVARGGDVQGLKLYAFYAATLTGAAVGVASGYYLFHLRARREVP